MLCFVGQKPICGLFFTRIAMRRLRPAPDLILDVTTIRNRHVADPFWHHGEAMLRPIDNRSYWLKMGPMVAASIISLVILISVCISILNNTSDNLIKINAQQDAIAWAGYIGDSIERIEDITKGAALNEKERDFLTKTRTFGDIFRFNFFDADGKLILTSDSIHDSTAANENLGKHNPHAAGVVSTGQPYAEIKNGKGIADRPDVYVEAYVPILKNGKIIAISEVYIDKTASSALIKADFVVFGTIIAGLTILVLLVPLWGLRMLTQELQKRNYELNIERARAVEAENAKSAFLAHMSHELRTPLNAIQGLSEMMVRGDLGKLNHAKYFEYSKDINFSAMHLLRLVNDILDLSKIEAGKFELLDSKVDIGNEINAALRIARAWQVPNNLALPADLSTGQMYARADQRALKQIFLNLLSNAVKFSPNGGDITVTAKIDEYGNGVVLIKDTGYGIPDSDIGEITKPFNQVHKPVSLRQEGTGLGLSLVKSMIELHGGKLLIESQENVGTCVSVIIPAERIMLN